MKTGSAQRQPAADAPRVSVVMPFLNAERFLEEAVNSVLAQTFESWELLLVDDGSRDASTALAQSLAERYPDRIRYLAHEHHENRGASAARNLGIRHARGEYLALLDADDIWLPGNLEHLVPLLDAWPEAASVYTNTLFWYSWSDSAAPAERDYMPRLGVSPNTLLQPPELMTRCWRGLAAVPCTCALLIRRTVVEAIGGFEERFRQVFTDQAFYTKLFLAAPVFVADGCWNWYRQHPASSCATIESAGQLHERRLDYLHWADGYLSGLGLDTGAAGRALKRELWWNGRPRAYRARQTSRRAREQVKDNMKHAVRTLLPAPVRQRLHGRFPELLPQERGDVHFGPLHRTTPVSRHFGFDRGQPIDRYYIEGFLSRHAVDVRGEVLEVGDDVYTRKLGGARVRRSHVLHVKAGNPKATLIGDLADAPDLPPDAFDCIILTQTLNLIYDMPAAVRTLHRILAPGGTCLVTVPGITQLEVGEWRDTWYWALTERSAERMFGEVFGAPHVHVESRGNVLAACAFLQGLACHELRQQELDHFDPSYPVAVLIRATKPDPA